MNSHMFDRPDWVICGMPRGEGEAVAVLASTELNSAELRYEAERETDLYGHVCGSWSRTVLTIDMRKYVFIQAPDYSSALRHLFEKWAPQERKMDALRI